MRKWWLAAVAAIICTPGIAQVGVRSLSHMDEHFDYWIRCSDIHYDLERRISYCKSMLGDGRHSQQEVLTEIGNAYLAARKYAEAAASYRDALAQDDSWCEAERYPCYVTDANEGLEEALVLSGQFDSAMNHVKGRMKDDLDATAPYNARCWLRGIEGRDLESALADCNEALKRAPRAGSPFNSRGLVYFRLGKLQEAQTDYNAALDNDPTIASAYYVRGIIELRTGLSDEGSRDIRTANRYDPAVSGRFKGCGIEP